MILIIKIHKIKTLTLLKLSQNETSNRHTTTYFLRSFL